MSENFKQKKNILSHILAMVLLEELRKAGLLGIGLMIFCWTIEDEDLSSTDGNGSISSKSRPITLEENCSRLVIDRTPNLSLYPSELGIENIVFGSSPTSRLNKYRTVLDASGKIKSDLLVFGPNDIWILEIKKSPDILDHLGQNPDEVEHHGRITVVLHDLFSNKKITAFAWLVRYIEDRPPSSYN